MKKTTLALAALIALTSGSALAAVKKDYQLNFFAQIEDGFSFERLDGESWSKAIDIDYSPLRNEFSEKVVQTRVLLDATHVGAGKKLTAKINTGAPQLVNKADYTKVIGLEVKLNDVLLGSDFKPLLAKNADPAAENIMPLSIDAGTTAPSTTGDYEGKFAITFEYGV